MTPFDSADEKLFNKLLILTGDYTSSRPTDGVLAYQNIRDNTCIKIVGVVILIDKQNIEPFKSIFTLRDNQVVHAQVRFGLSNSPIILYDSNQHQKIKNAICADIDTPFDWRYLFTYQAGSWALERKNLTQQD